jgi:hypothetical protein
MNDTNTAHPFERAMIIADNETLRDQIAAWFAKGNRTPENALDIAPIVQSAIDASFAVKIDECKRSWRNGEAEAWNQARQSFDAAMCAFVEAMGRQPNPDEIPAFGQGNKWGNASERPAIGAGWGRQTA